MNIREVCDIGENIQCRCDSKSEWTSNLDCAYWIFDFVEHIVRVLPPTIGVQDFEHRSCILVDGTSDQRRISK